MDTQQSSIPWRFIIAVIGTSIVIVVVLFGLRSVISATTQKPLPTRAEPAAVVVPADTSTPIPVSDFTDVTRVKMDYFSGGNFLGEIFGAPTWQCFWKVMVLMTINL